MIDYKDDIVPLENITYVTRPFSDDEVKELSELEASMTAKGLLHPVTLQRVPVDAIVDGEGRITTKAYKLVTGLKRLLAAKNLKWAVLPARVTDQIVGDDDLLEIHLHENLFGSKVPWWQEVILRKQLHELRQKQHGRGRQGAKVGWSLRDTAEELGMSFGTLSEDLRLAEAVMADSNLRKIDDKKTAKRLVFDMARRIEAEAEAHMAELSIKIDYNVVYCGDSAEILKRFPDNTFDVVFTDPPWIEFRDPALKKDAQTNPVFQELFRVMKRDSFLYVIVSTPDFIYYQQELPKMGFTVQQMPLIWQKQNFLSHGTRAWEYARDYEPILLAIKGNPILVPKGQMSAVYASKIVHTSKSIHPNEKPVDVPIHFLEHCTYEGSVVLDPFGGSGATAEACIRLGRKYVTIERHKPFADAIERRLTTVMAEQSSASQQS